MSYEEVPRACVLQKWWGEFSDKCWSLPKCFSRDLGAVGRSKSRAASLGARPLLQAGLGWIL